MVSDSGMKNALYWRKRTRKGECDEVIVGRSVIGLVWVVLAFVLLLLGHSLIGFIRLP
jgi:hypothetical protein